MFFSRVFQKKMFMIISFFRIILLSCFKVFRIVLNCGETIYNGFCFVNRTVILLDVNLALKSNSVIALYTCYWGLLRGKGICFCFT